MTMMPPYTQEELKLRIGLEWHLEYNHKPSLPSWLLEPCLQAIDYANGGEWDALIALPNGNHVTVREVVEYCHLDYYIQVEE